MAAERSKGELKRLQEQETVSMMIQLYCRKNHNSNQKKNRITTGRNYVRNAGIYLLMLKKKFKDVLLWRIRRFAATAGYIVTSQKCGKRFGK